MKKKIKHPFSKKFLVVDISLAMNVLLPLNCENTLMEFENNYFRKRV